MSGLIRNANGLARLANSLVGDECSDACCGEPSGTGTCGLCDGCPTSFVIDWTFCEWQESGVTYTVEAVATLEACPEIDPDLGVPNPPCSYRPIAQTQSQTVDGPFCSDAFVVSPGFAFCESLTLGNQFGWIFSIRCQIEPEFSGYTEVAAVLATLPPPYFIISINAGFESGTCASQGIDFTLVAVASVPLDSCLASATFTLVPFAFPLFYAFGAPAIDLAVEGTVTVS